MLQTLFVLVYDVPHANHTIVLLLQFGLWYVTELLSKMCNSYVNDVYIYFCVKRCNEFIGPTCEVIS